MAEAEDQASDIRFPSNVEYQLMHAAGQSQTEQELAVAAATKNKPSAYVLAAWNLIHDKQRQGRRARNRRAYRRRVDWTLREQQVALAMASGGKTVAQIATTLGRTRNAVRFKLRRCGLPNVKDSRDVDSYSGCQLAELLQVRPAVIRQWEDLGLSSRPKAEENCMSSGHFRLRRTGFIEYQCLESFFKTSDGIDAASRLDGMSLQKLTTLLGFDPCQINYDRSVEAAKRKSTQETERKQRARNAAAHAVVSNSIIASTSAAE